MTPDSENEANQTTRQASASLFTREIPLNYQTIVFAFLMGSLLSAPVGMIEDSYRPFTLPDWTATVYQYNWFTSFFALPIWCAFFRLDPILKPIGFVTFVLTLLAGLLFPAL